MCGAVGKMVLCMTWGGVSPTLSCGQHSGVEPKIMVFEDD